MTRRSTKRIAYSRQLVLNMAGQDTGGQCHRIKDALWLHSKRYYARNFVIDNTYMNHPTDIVYGSHNPEDVNNLLKQASILHIHNKHRYYRKWGTVPKPIPSIIHQHGRICDVSKIKDLHIADSLNKSLRIVSTFNLLRWIDGDISRWLPSPIDVDLYSQLVKQKQKRDDKKVRICHFPTNRRLKHTELLIDTVNKLKQHHPEIELILVEGKSYDEVIKTKMMCDIGFDQLLLWYGNNAIEFWALGIPCIVGMSDSTRDISKNFFGYEPWAYANEQNLYRVLEELVSDPSCREKMGKEGRQHVERYHSYPEIVKKLEYLYGRSKDLFDGVI